MKAKSRLSSSAAMPDVGVHQPNPVTHHSTHVQTPSVRTQRSLSSLKKNVHSSAIMSKYLTHVLTLLLCIPFYTAVYLVVTKIQPGQLKNVLIPNVYFFFQLPLLIGDIFLASFLFLNTRRGFLCAVAIQILIFAKLQSLAITPLFVVVVLIVISAIEGLCSLINKNSSAHLDQVAYNRKSHV